MARLWDVRSGELLGTFKGHLCSLKSVAFTPEEKCNVSPKQNLYLLGEITYFVYKTEKYRVFFHIRINKQLFIRLKSIT